MLSINQKERYARHIILDDFGEHGQEQLLSSKVLVVGMGGLGSNASTQLIMSGVGHLIINDYDVITRSNLHRQPLFSEHDIGKRKVEVAARRLQDLQADATIGIIDKVLNEAELETILPSVTLVLDCLDNFPSRYKLHHVAYKYHIPIVSAGVITHSGHVALFNNRNDDPCFECIFPKPILSFTSETDGCQERGVLGALVGVIGSMQSLLAVQWIANSTKNYSYEHILFSFNTHTLQWGKSVFYKDQDCLGVCHQ
ncbi:MAG: HesA/MoeB/ThiF family protein [Methylacidiphilales bacterium]|nr:HesA/MoeB/ThiF family protein [Candidatus Methylacidiphilales bacterium]